MKGKRLIRINYMQFNTHIFILFFLPISIISYFIINRLSKNKNHIGNCFLLILSIIFYAYAGVKILFFLIFSIIINYIFILLQKKINYYNRIILSGAIIINVLILLSFKYLNFFILNINTIFNKEIASLDIILPLGISFFTFQQIQYQVETYYRRTQSYSFFEYVLYVFYFPKLIMGPLTDPHYLITQFRDPQKKNINLDNIVQGIQLFVTGLLKKLCLADVFAQGVDWGFTNQSIATSGDLIIVMLAYTFQIYFDFSGYTDMANGISKMLNISLPINFNSPYKAFSIREFWKRWHMSLTHFLTQYIYIPLGGSKKGNTITYINTLVVFVISGIWHGANWTFILWGFLHGMGQILNRIFQKQYEKINPVVQWFLTFSYINILWLLFRSASITEWITMLKNILHLSDMNISQKLINKFIRPETQIIFKTLRISFLNEKIYGFSLLFYIAISFIICLCCENTNSKEHKKSFLSLIFIVLGFVWCLTCLGTESTFVYFNF